jgi:hypothetical protein
MLKPPMINPLAMDSDTIEGMGHDMVMWVEKMSTGETNIAGMVAGFDSSQVFYFDGMPVTPLALVQMAVSNIGRIPYIVHLARDILFKKAA